MSTAAHPGDAAQPAPRRARWGRRGYRADEVDDFLRRLHEDDPAEPPALAPYQVADARFRSARFRRHYDYRAVDSLLRHEQESLRTRHGDTALGRVEGRLPEPRTRSVWWVYAVALLLILGMLAFVLTQR